MSWVHDTGYGPALDHEGGVADVLKDGTDPGTPPDQLGPQVVGWRSACECGWQGTEFFLCAEWPGDEQGLAPGGVADRCRSDWERHLRVAMPVLAVHDLTRRIAELREDLETSVRQARAAGVDWTVIGAAAGIDQESARNRWSGVD